MQKRQINLLEGIQFHIAFAAGDFWVDGVRWYEGDYVPPDLGEKTLTESGDYGFWQYP